MPNKKILLEGILIGLPAVVIGAYSISYIDEVLARKLLGVLILSVFLLSFLKKAECTNENIPPFLIYGLLFLIGFLNGSLSAGTGLLYTLMLTKIYGMSFKQAIGYTLLVVGLFFNLIGALTLYLISTIDLNILPLLIIGSFFGGYVGAMIAISKSNKFIKTAYQFVTLIVAYKLLF